MGGIQKVVDRVSAALLPVHAAIGDRARRALVYHVDETGWQQSYTGLSRIGATTTSTKCSL